MIKKLVFLTALVTLLICCFASCSCESQVPEAPMATVKFESKTDTQLPAVTVEIGKPLQMQAAAISKPGYVLVGWYNGEKKWDFNKNVVTGDMTLVAKWESYLSYAAVSEIDNSYVKLMLGKENEDGIIVTGCKFGVENVVIPSTYNGKKVVGIHLAFTGRKEIKSVVIPETVAYIGSHSFERCESLERIVIPSGVTALDRGAFFLCTKLEGIYCRASVKPPKWHDDYNLKSSSGGERYKVVFGYTGN